MHDISMVLIQAAIKSVFKYLSKTRGDEDTKWSVHFTTQKPQQGLIFVPGKRRSGSADDLQESHGLTQQLPTSSHCHDPSIASSWSSSGLHQSERSSCSGWKNKSHKMKSRFLDFFSQSCFSACFHRSFRRRKPSASSDEDERVILSNRPLTPLVLNPLHLTSTLNVSAPSYQPIVHVDIEPSSRLPTPEEKMRQLSEAVGADIVPINITGESFDRQASFRKRLSSADSLSRLSRNLSRQTTLTGKPDIKHKLDSSSILPGEFSTVDGPVSSCTSNHQEKNRDKELEKRNRAQLGNQEQPSAVKIQAPRGKTTSVLMAPLTCAPHVDPSSYCCTPVLEVRTLSSLATNSHLDSESSFTTTPYRTPGTPSSCSQAQVLQGFPSDLMPLLPFGPKAKVIPKSPLNSSSSLSSFPVSLSSSPSHESEWSYPSDKPLNEAAQCNSSTSSSQYRSSSSLADSESQFSYQALHDQTQHSNQLSYDGSSFSDDSWSYQPLSPSSSLHSSQMGGDWSSMNQEKCFSGEGWNCDPLLSSGRSSPAFSDCNSLSSENISSSFLLNQKTMKSSTSSYSHTIIRSISLRKSKHPPLPPLRCDSLRRQPGRTKPSHSSYSARLNNSLCLERAIQQTLSSAQTFHDPWVPRENTKTLPTGLNCSTVTTFEPFYPDCEVAASSVSEHLPQSPSHADVIPPGSPGSEEESLNSHPAKSSVVGLHRLVSPSSGYSSQSNTPLSSPLAPSSPLTASSGTCPLTSPLSSSHSFSKPLSPPISNLPKMRSQGDGRPKPPVPERKSSLFSYSTSSLSSCISSEHPVIPPLPPPPLPSSPASSVFYSPIFEFAPPPYLCLTAESSVSKLSGTPTPFSSSLPPHCPPHPPPPPPLPTSSLPTPPPLPPSSHPPPPPYSYTIRNALEPTLSQSPVFFSSPSSEIPPLPLTDLLPAPPPPYLPSLPSPSSVAPLPTPSLSKSCVNPCVSVPTCPLVTAQALQSVKLRSMKDQKGLPDSIMLANTMLAADCTLHNQAFPMHADTFLPRKEAQANCSVFGNANDEDLAHSEAKPAGVGPQTVACNLGRNETSMSSGFGSDNNNAKRHALQSDQKYCNVTKCEMRKSSNAESICVSPQSLQFIVSSPVTQRKSDCQIIQSRERHISHPDSTWIELLMGNDQHHIDTVSQETYLHEHQISDNTLTNAKLMEPADKHGNTENDSSYWTEVPHKHCRVTLLESKDEVNSNDKNHSEMQNQTAADNPVAYSDATQSDRVFKSETDFPLTSARNKEPLFASKNTEEVHSSTSGTCGTLEITRMSHNQNTTATSTTGIMRTSDSKNTLSGVISTVNNWHSAEGSCTMERSNVSSMGYKTWMCLPSGNMDWTTNGMTNTTDGTMSTLENYGISGTLQTLENLGEHVITSAQADGIQYGATELCTVYKDTLTFYNRIVKSSLTEDEEDEDEEDKKVEQRATKMSSTKFHKSDKARKRRKRRSCRQLLMMQSTTKPSPSSSSSSSSSSLSSSSGDELDVVKERTSESMRMAKEVCDEETSNSDSCCTQSRCSLSSELSSESLFGELPFPDLLIQETVEKEEKQISNEEAQRTAKEPRGLPGDLFLSVSADQMFMSSQSRTTEDLFAVIHRSKRKMLERRSSEETRRCTKSPSADPGPSSTRPAAFKTSKSSRTESFKALLLRKGSRSNPRTGTSAVERLCKVISPTNNLQSVLDQTPVKPTSTFNTLTRRDAAAHLTPDVSVFSQNTSTIHTHLLFFPPSMRLRSLTPPCSSSSRFAAHFRLVAAPMTAISEGLCEEDNE